LVSEPLPPLRRSKFETPRPFLKWVGGKGQLLPILGKKFESAKMTGRYHEPFTGGGALFFHLYRQKMLGKKKAFLSDNNPRLIETYRAVQEDVESLIELLRAHKAKHDHDYYYAVRAAVPDSTVERAARIIYLNKTCFNGLYRENSLGLFNVPLGKYKNPAICDEVNLRACAEALRHATLAVQSFDAVLTQAAPGDFVYFDPPYDPVSTTSSFTAYNQQAFGAAEQARLAAVFAELAAKDVRVMLSNSYTPRVTRLYKAFHPEKILATRSVNSRSDRRGEVAEALVCRF
jgi:DNA adenine methylase